MYAIQQVSLRLPRAASISRWKAAEAFLSPIGITSHLSRPCVLVMNAVQSLEFSASGSCQKAELRSSRENHVAPANWSRDSFTSGMGYPSLTTQSLTFLRSATALNPPPFFGTSKGMTMDYCMVRLHWLQLIWPHSRLR